MKSGICAYIDILGYKDFVRENQEGAIMLLQNYQVQLNLLTNFPNDEYTTPYRIDSFKYLIPFSDSIFFYSEMPSDFIMQLSNFINGSFSFTSNAFSNPEDPQNPENVTQKTVIWENNKATIKEIPSKWFPLLFRGGIGFGDARIMEINGIADNEIQKMPFIFGNSVVEAVLMETIKVNDEKIKGPRILCSELFYNQLNHRAKKIVHRAFDEPKFFEINWTAVNYLMTDELNDWFVDNLLMNDFYLNQFVPACNLWKAYKNTDLEMHYRNFLKLIVKGVQHYFLETKYSTKVEVFIIDTIHKEELHELKGYLMK